MCKGFYAASHTPNQVKIFLENEFGGFFFLANSPWIYFISVTSRRWFMILSLSLRAYPHGLFALKAFPHS